MAKAKRKIIQTENESWGFWGTLMDDYAEADVMVMWDEASLILRRYIMLDEDVRAFLDSSMGRHWADQLAGEIGRKRTVAEALWACFCDERRLRKNIKAAI